MAVMLTFYAIFHGPGALATLVMKMVRRDPRPKFDKWHYPEDELEEQLIQSFDDVKDFIITKVPHVKTVTSKKRETRPGDPPEDTEAVAKCSYALSTKNKHAYKVFLELEYTALKVADSDVFGLEDCDCDDSTVSSIRIVSPAQPKSDIILYIGDQAAQWLAIAALRGDVKVSAPQQIWFYLKEYDIWALSYKGDDTIGYRKTFVDKRASRFGLR